MQVEKLLLVVKKFHTLLILKKKKKYLKGLVLPSMRTVEYLQQAWWHPQQADCGIHALILNSDLQDAHHQGHNL